MKHKHHKSLNRHLNFVEFSDDKSLNKEKATDSKVKVTQPNGNANANANVNASPNQNTNQQNQQNQLNQPLQPNQQANPLQQQVQVAQPDVKNSQPAQVKSTSENQNMSINANVVSQDKKDAKDNKSANQVNGSNDSFDMPDVSITISQNNKSQSIKANKDKKDDENTEKEKESKNLKKNSKNKKDSKKAKEENSENDEYVCLDKKDVLENPDLHVFKKDIKSKKVCFHRDEISKEFLEKIEEQKSKKNDKSKVTQINTTNPIIILPKNQLDEVKRTQANNFQSKLDNQANPINQTNSKLSIPNSNNGGNPQMNLNQNFQDSTKLVQQQAPLNNNFQNTVNNPNNVNANENIQLNKTNLSSQQESKSEGKQEEKKDIINLLSSDKDYIELYKSNKEAAGLVAKILNKMLQGKDKNQNNNSLNPAKNENSNKESMNKSEKEVDVKKGDEVEDLKAVLSSNEENAGKLKDLVTKIIKSYGGKKSRSTLIKFK